jgi:hypothetical protein
LPKKSTTSHTIHASTPPLLGPEQLPVVAILHIAQHPWTEGVLRAGVEKRPYIGITAFLRMSKQKPALRTIKKAAALTFRRPEAKHSEVSQLSPAAERRKKSPATDILGLGRPEAQSIGTRTFVTSGGLVRAACHRCDFHPSSLRRREDRSVSAPQAGGAFASNSESSLGRNADRHRKSFTLFCCMLARRFTGLMTGSTNFSCLFTSITRDLTSCRIYEVYPATCKAGNRLILVFGHFFGRKALDVVSGPGAAV